LLRNGCIAEVSCYNKENFVDQRDLIYGFFGKSHDQKFCIGLVTAECEDTDTALPSADEERWSQGYGRSITRNIKAREKCTSSSEYLRRSLLLYGVAVHYQSFLIPMAETK